MVRHQTWFRTLATLLAVWLPLVAGEPGVLQPCPMHGAERAVIASLRGEAVAPGMVGNAMASTTGHMHHAATAPESASADRSSSAPDGGHHCCSCIDGCSAASAVAFVVPEPASAQIVVVASSAGSSVPTVESLARPAPEFSRPYTTGPPRA